MEIPLLKDIVIIFGISLIVLVISHRFRVPTIVGFLLTGMIAGPYGLRLIKSVHEVEALSEFGVILLLFTIGLEFSFKELFRLKKAVLLGGSLQVVITIFVTMIILFRFGFEEALNRALFGGFLIALSSTAIVLKIFQEMAEVETPHGQTALAILIFQDIIVVLLMLLPPILAGTKGDVKSELILLLAKGFLIVVLVILSARYVVPKVLYHVAQTRSRELFLLCICAIGLTVAWLTSRAGLSLGLGAFLAGLIISESEFSLEALGGVRPFRDVFTSFFFISIGMLLNLAFALKTPVLTVLFSLGVITVKFLILFIICGIMRLNLRTAFIVSLSLCQIGEFSFILSKEGLKYGLLNANHYQLFLAVSVLSMVTAPFLIAAAPRLYDVAIKISMFKAIDSVFRHEPAKDALAGTRTFNDHLIVVGFGENGKMLVRAAKAATIPYTIIEMNVETVRKGREQGEPFIYGDATNEFLFEHASIEKARVVAVAISDPAATRHIVRLARRLNPNIHIIARTRFITEVEALYELGADEVIPAEFETAVEIFARTLAKFLIPKNKIEEFVSEIRADGYRMLRSLSIPSASVKDLSAYLSGLDINIFRVEENSPAAEKSLAEIELRRRYGVMLLAIRRKQEIIPNPDANTRLLVDDHLVLIGRPENIASAAGITRGDI